MGKKGAAGAGSIRRIERSGKVYWEGRCVTGRDPLTGKAIRKSVTAPTQAECRKKLAALVKSVDDGTYTNTSKLTVAQWLTQWLNVYAARSLAPRTITIYKSHIENHICPNIGGIRLSY